MTSYASASLHKDCISVLNSRTKQNMIRDVMYKLHHVNNDTPNINKNPTKIKYSIYEKVLYICGCHKEDN